MSRKGCAIGESVPRPGLETEASLLAWVERIRKGDREAEDSLVRFFQPRVYTFAQRNLRDARLSEDVVQETLWAAIKTLREGRLEDPRNLAGFVYGVARHRVADMHRKASRDRHVEWPENFDPPCKFSPEEDDRQRMALAEQVMQRLEPTDQGILEMLLVQGLPLEEIGRRLKLRPEAVRQRKSRALRRVVERIRDFTAKGRIPWSQTAGGERQNKQGRDR